MNKICPNPDCGCFVSIDESLYNPGDVVPGNCQLCGCRIEFVIPDIKSSENQDVHVVEKVEASSIDKIVKELRTLRLQMQKLQSEIEILKRQNSTTPESISSAEQQKLPLTSSLSFEESDDEDSSNDNKDKISDTMMWSSLALWGFIILFFLISLYSC